MKNPSSYSGITLREKARGGLKKQEDGETSKCGKCAGLCLNDGWRIVLISVPRGEHVERACHFLLSSVR